MHARLALPPHLAERLTDHTPLDATSRVADPVATTGEFVLYWMRTALRAHENPALDVALATGRLFGLPVFVYHGLSERYPYAADRHHQFILQGVIDVAGECAARGIGYAFHLERPGHRQKALREWGPRAAVVVTETMPVPPLDDLTRALAAQLSCPVWSVDTACVIPMPLVETAHTRAFAFREATFSLRQERVHRPWVDQVAAHPVFVPRDLPFEPVVVTPDNVAALVASCRIDHAVPAVGHSRGGSRAGYARWNQFVRSGGLSRYAALRNDAAIDGVSRMSAYLHYGMVSPFRIARECVAQANEGADKYLDELLVWRELAYAFCYWHPSPTTLDAVPDWARDTLHAHEGDARTVLPLDALERSDTGDALWDAAQRALRETGELHNNVRMTWGKAILQWSRDAADAWNKLVDLNHKFALDGRDPASYGGLLWCLGQFDRPFTPEQPIFGRVRTRPTSVHAKRLDVRQFAARIEALRSTTDATAT